eukprot:1940494-Pleurochrysis_carterae.AAC.2
MSWRARWSIAGVCAGVDAGECAVVCADVFVGVYVIGVARGCKSVPALLGQQRDTTERKRRKGTEH